MPHNLTPVKKTMRAAGEQGRRTGSQCFLFLPQLVTKEDPKALAVALNWDLKKTETVQHACNQELSLRLRQIQSLHSLRNVSARRNSLPGELRSPKRAKRDPP